MALRPIDPGLRRLFQNRNDVSKVSLVVPAGDELTTSDAVAEQLLRSGDFVDLDAAKPAAPAPEAVADEAPADTADEAPKGKKKG